MINCISYSLGFYSYNSIGIKIINKTKCQSCLFCNKLILSEYIYNFKFLKYKHETFCIINNKGTGHKVQKSNLLTNNFWVNSVLKVLGDLING